MNILVSTCLLGVACKYSGGDNACPAVLALAGRHTLIPGCPEVYGGLPTPCPPAERRGDRVVTEQGNDVTAQYQKGALAAVRLAGLTGCKAAVLKKNSPSCGCGQIYDGTFTHTLAAGSGLTAEALLAAGIPVYNEDTCDTL